MVIINDPAVVAEVTARCEAYEQALVTNDVAALTAFFWDSAQAVRFGVGEQLYGAEAISAFRQNRVINFTDRRPLRLTVLAIGQDVAVAMLEFYVVVGGQSRHGRQTQVWTRFSPTVWRIVSAHVSHAATPALPAWQAYAERVGHAIQLPLDPEHLPGVSENLRRAAEIAAPLLDFALPPEIEQAPVFTP
jgi:ketosteroid isomerase-like protein